MATAHPTATVATLAALLDHLGGIDPARALIVRPLGEATEEDLIRHARGGSLPELVDGLLVEKGMGFNEADLALALGAYLRAFVLPRNLGLVVGADGMIRLAPGLVRLPDVSYTSWDRIPGRRRPTEPIAGFAPDLAVEVLSLSNTPAEMARKRAEYFAAGVRLVWEVDPRSRTVAVYSGPDESTILDVTGTLDGGPILPGFLLPLADLFAELDRHG